MIRNIFKNRTNIFPMKSFLLITLCLLAAFFTPTIYGQVNSFLSAGLILTQREGMLDESITAIEKDGLGYLWIGTTSGLNRFDGTETKEWTIEDSLYSEWIVSLEYDSSNNKLWIGTSQGLNYMDLYDYTMHKENEGGNQNFDLSNQWVTGLVMLSSQQLLCYNNGLLLYNPESKKSKHYIPSFDKRSEFITQVIQDQNDKNILWCASASGLLEFDLKTNTFKNQYLFENGDQDLKANINLLELFLFQAPNGIIYAGSLNGGLFIFNPKNKSTTIFRKKYKNEYFAESTLYKQIELINDSELIIFTNKGIIQYNYQEERITEFHPTTDYNSKTFIPAFKDQQNRIWVSSANGLQVIDLENSRYNIIDFNKNKIPSNGSITAIVEAPKTQILYFIQDQGAKVFRYDIVHKTFLEPLEKFHHSSLAEDHQPKTMDLLLTSEGDLLLLTAERLYALVENTFVEQTYIPALDMLPYVSMAVLSDGRMVVVSTYKGALIYDPKNKELIAIEPTKLLGDGHWGHNAFPDKDNGFWLSQLGRGLSYFDEKLQLKEQIPFQDETNNIGHFSIKDLIFIKKNIPLICGGKRGLLKKENKGQIAKIKNRKLKDTPIYAFAKDKKEHIWMLGEKGLIRTNNTLDQHIFFAYPDERFNITTTLRQGIGLHQLSNGQMVFANDNALCFFDPLAINQNNELTVPRIDFLSTQNNKIIKNIHHESITLPYKDNNLSFNFHGINFTQGITKKYQYKLEGVDNYWSKPTFLNQVNYGNLAPGEYTFQLKSKNIDNIWSKNPDTFSFTILPPWWQTWWAYLFYTIILFSGLFLWYYYQRNKWQLQSNLLLEKEKNEKLILQKKAEIIRAHMEGSEIERERLSRDLHDGAGAMLVSIGFFLESIALKHSQLQNDKTFNRCKAIVNETYDEVRSLSHQMMPNYIRKSGFVNAVKILMNSIPKESAIKVKTSINITEDKIPDHYQLHIYRILQELISNISKHAKAHYINLEMTIKHSVLHIHLKNDGLQYDIENALQKDGIGLKNIQYRMDIIKAILEKNNDEKGETNYFIKVNLKPQNTTG